MLQKVKPENRKSCRGLARHRPGLLCVTGQTLQYGLFVLFFFFFLILTLSQILVIIPFLILSLILIVIINVISSSTAAMRSHHPYQTTLILSGQGKEIQHWMVRARHPGPIAHYNPAQGYLQDWWV